MDRVVFAKIVCHASEIFNDQSDSIHKQKYGTHWMFPPSYKLLHEFSIDFLIEKYSVERYI